MNRIEVSRFWGSVNDSQGEGIARSKLTKILSKYFFKDPVDSCQTQCLFVGRKKRVILFNFCFVPRSTSLSNFRPSKILKIASKSDTKRFLDNSASRKDPNMRPEKEKFCDGPRRSREGAHWLIPGGETTGHFHFTIRRQRA